MASGAYDVACGAVQMSDERRENRYGGGKYDPRETENDLAVKIVESMADEISFGYDDKGNEVQVVINTQEGNK